MAAPEEYYTTCIYLPGIGLLRGKPTLFCVTTDFSFSEASNIDDKVIAATVGGQTVAGIVNVKKISVPDKTVHNIAEAALELESRRKIINESVHPLFDKIKPILVREAETRGVYTS